VNVTASAQPENRLTGRRLTLARSLWIVVVALALGLYILSLPSQIALRETLCSGSACANDQISPNDLQQLQQVGISLHANAVYFVAVNTLFVLVFLIVAAIIFWRRSNEGIGLFASLVLATFGISFSGALETLGAHYPALLLPAQLVDTLGGASMSILFLVFPNGRFVPRWSLLLAPFFVLHEALRLFAPGLLGANFAFPVLLGFIVCAQIYRYLRVSNAIERQQTKWTLAGMSVGVVGFGGLLTWAILFSGGRPTGLTNLIGSTALYLFLMLIPLSIGMAILRSHLWDIDILIRRTLVYAALTGLLALAYFGSVVVLEGLVRLFTGQSQSQVVTVVSTLVIAALFVPLRGRVQAFIDRRFYRRKYNAAQTLAAFSNSVRDEVELGRLAEHLTEVVDETLQPESVSLWIRGQPGTGATSGQGGPALHRDL
jgi:hypothetical protein